MKKLILLIETKHTKQVKVNIINIHSKLTMLTSLDLLNDVLGGNLSKFCEQLKCYHETHLISKQEN